MTRTRISHRILLALVLAAGLILLGGRALYAQMDMQAEDTLSLSGTLGDMGFYAGGELTVSATSDDDIFVAGGEIDLAGTGADHLIVGGGEISANNIAVQDLIIAGGNLSLNSGTISDDIVAFGGNIELGAALSVGSSAVISGGNVEIDTDIGDELRVSAGNVVLNGSVGGDVWLAGGNVEIGPNVVIDGNLTYQAEDFSMDPSATVTGEIIVEEYEGGKKDFSVEGVIATLFAMLFFLIPVGILVLAAVAIFPGLMNRSGEMIGSKPFSAIGVGFVVMIALPFLAVLFMITIVGIPAGLMLLALAIVLKLFALSVFAYFCGMKLRGLSGRKDEPYITARILWTLLAWVILMLLLIIPFVGFLIWFIGVVMGTGAIAVRGGSALADE